MRKVAMLVALAVLVGGTVAAGEALAPSAIRDPGNDPDAFWNALDWTEMTIAEQALWETLGWDEASWSGEAPPPASEGLFWHELRLREQAAARLLGYDATTWDGEPTFDLLFVQSAASGSYEDGRLVLHGVLHSVFFSERPGRVVGSLSNADFAAYWSRTGLNSFSDDPPNAALSIREGEAVLILELLGAPEVAGDALTYEVRLLEGSFIGPFERAALFIDAIPTAVDGQITDAVTQAFTKSTDD